MDEKALPFTLGLIAMVLSDTENFVTHFTLVAEKTGNVRVSYYL